LIVRWIVLSLLLLAAPARAELNIEITGAGEHQTPLSLVRFGGDPLIAHSLLEVVGGDLARTGLFRLVDPAGRLPHSVSEVRSVEWEGTETLLLGSIEEVDGGQLAVRFSLFDVVRNAELMAQVVTAKRGHLRAIAHRIADLVYERLTGSPGVFSTRIVYVNRDRDGFRLVVADSDGYGEQSLLTSKEPIMSPAWSPDGRQIAYVSFERHRAMVYVQSIDSAQRRLLAEFPGSNSAPVWSPDGTRLALVLTRDGSSNLYLVGRDGQGLRRITRGSQIDTEPAFTADGQNLLFTSDRGGSPQIYRLSLADETVTRLTFESGSTFSPRVAPDGKGFVFSLFKEGLFYIAVQDFDSAQTQILTGGGWEKKPSFAPNGKMILFATEINGRGILSTVSSDGRVKQKMVAQRGDIREPMWGPFPK